MLFSKTLASFPEGKGPVLQEEQSEAAARGELVPLPCCLQASPGLLARRREGKAEARPNQAVLVRGVNAAALQGASVYTPLHFRQQRPSG